MGLIKTAMMSGAVYAIARDFNKKKERSGDRSPDNSHCQCSGHAQPSEFQYQQQQHYQPHHQHPMAMQRQYQQQQYQPQQYYSQPANYQQPPPAYQNQPYMQEQEARAPVQAASKN